MIIPSIDLEGGTTVQLVGGEEKAIDAGDPLPIAQCFSIAGEISVVDVDAARGAGSNAEIIKKLLPVARCRVGGGIRDVETALAWLEAGAAKVILGTAATPEVLKHLPPERVIAALDAKEGEVVVKGWREATGRGVLSRMKELEGLVDGFLVTFVEREGRMGGTDLTRIGGLVKMAGKARVTIAGGVTTAGEIAELDRHGADAQVGMALYTGKLDLAEALAAPLVSDRADKLWPTVVVAESGEALGLAWSSAESLRMAIQTRHGVYHSRTRGIWFKGETSGATQNLLRIDADCDRDTLRFVVRQEGSGFCHTGAPSCWGDGWGMAQLARRLALRKESAPSGSYTEKLLADPKLLAAKLVEEAEELAEAKGATAVTAEAADLVYFTLVALARGGVSFEQLTEELDRRGLKVSRRKGDAKPGKKTNS